jgi:hypothetical protein
MDVKKLMKNPTVLGVLMITTFFFYYIASLTIPGTLPIFVLCAISNILSVYAIIFDFKFLNSIVIGYWCIYLVTIADLIVGAGAFGYHVINLVLATIVLAKRWKNSWPVLIFLSGFLWATIIGTEKMITGGASEYFRMFDWRLMSLFIMFDAFMAIVIYLAQNPKKRASLMKKIR